MRTGSKRMFFAAMGAVTSCLLAIALASGQSGTPSPAAAGRTVEQAYKNIQVLKGMPASQLIPAMQFFAASLGVSCSHCHDETAYDKDIMQPKATARKMLQMMAAINRDNFNGLREVTCFTCHRADTSPAVTPSLAGVYNPPDPLEPDELIEVPAGTAPSANEIFDKYLQAVGGAQAAASFTSMVAKGSIDLDGDKRTLDIFAKAPDQNATLIHTDKADTVTAYDGRAGWTAAPGVASQTLTGSDLEGVKMDGSLFFPARLKQLSTQWRVGLPATIADKDANVVQGTVAGSPIKLYFDSESGLLVRAMRYTEFRVGRNPIQIDFTDYRDVAGVKVPFTRTITKLTSITKIELEQVQRNVPVDQSKFARPAAPPKAGN